MYFGTCLFTTAFITIIPQQQKQKLGHLRLKTSLCKLGPISYWENMECKCWQQSYHHAEDRGLHNDARSAHCSSPWLRTLYTTLVVSVVVGASLVTMRKTTTGMRFVVQIQILGNANNEDHYCTDNSISLAKEADRCLYFLSKLRRAPPIINSFYCGTIKNVLTGCIAVVWRLHCLLP